MPDLFGLGGRWMGAGGGGVAVVEDGTAAFLNPAGLSRVRRPTVALGYVAGWPQFDATPDLWWDTNQDGALDDRDPPLSFDANPDPIRGILASASRHIGGKFGIGFTAYVPTSNFIRFRTFEPSLPNYIMWDNRPQRFVAAAGIGGEIVRGLSIGAGVDLLAKGRLTVAATLSASAAPPDETGTDLGDVVTQTVVDVHRIDMSVVPALAPIVGIQLDFGRWTPVLDGLVLGASYREQVGLPLDIDLSLQVNGELSDLGSLDPFAAAVVAEGQFALVDHFVPRRLGIGIAYRRAGALTAYVDGRWTDWRAMELNVAQIASASLVSPLVDLTDTIVDGNAYTYTVRSTWSLRMGADLQLPEIPVGGSFRYLRPSFRGGFGYEPTPLVDQGAGSAMLDADRMLFTLGLGLEHWDPLKLNDGAVRWDVFAQWHQLQRGSLPRSAAGPRAGFPIDATALTTGGSVPVVGGQFSFDY